MPFLGRAPTIGAIDDNIVTSAKIETPSNLLEKYNHSGSSFIIKTNYNGIRIPYSDMNF